jgi:hypothetical protein
MTAAYNGSPRIVYVPAGEYKTTGQLSFVGNSNFDNVQHPYSVLFKGDGPTLTKIKGYSNSNSLIYFGAALNQGAGGEGSSTLLLSGNTRGSNEVTMNGNPTGGYLQVGRYIVVLHQNSATGEIDRGNYTVAAQSQIVKVTALNSSTNKITFTPSLNAGFTGDHVGLSISPAYHSGISDMALERASGFIGADNITMEDAEECWIQRVESDKCGRWHFNIRRSARCEVRNNYIHDGPDGSSNTMYGIAWFQWTSNCLAEDNILVHLRHSMITEWGGNGNVFGYNYSKDPINEGQFSTDYLMGDMCAHGGGRFNLWEGNVASNIRPDIAISNNGQLTFFRNRVTRKSIPSVYLACMGRDVQAANYDITTMGNYFEAPPVLFTSGINRLGSDQDATGSVITNATNATPIRVTYGFNSGRLFTVANGALVTIRGVSGNTNANVTLAAAAVIDSTTFDLTGVSGNAAFSGNGGMDDPNVLATLLIDGDFDIVTGLVAWASGDHSLVDSEYTTRPPWWNGAAFPAIGPDLDGQNPAFDRWANFVAAGSTNKALLFNSTSTFTVNKTFGGGMTVGGGLN